MRRGRHGAHSVDQGTAGGEALGGGGVQGRALTVSPCSVMMETPSRRRGGMGPSTFGAQEPIRRLVPPLDQAPKSPYSCSRDGGTVPQEVNDVISSWL